MTTFQVIPSLHFCRGSGKQTQFTPLPPDQSRCSLNLFLVLTSLTMARLSPTLTLSYATSEYDCSPMAKKPWCMCLEYFSSKGYFLEFIKNKSQRTCALLKDFIAGATGHKSINYMSSLEEKLKGCCHCCCCFRGSIISSVCRAHRSSEENKKHTRCGGYSLNPGPFPDVVNNKRTMVLSEHLSEQEGQL